MAELLEPIDHARIDPDALKVVRRLARYHHEAYLVGGCVRDLLLGGEPKDFDLATSATPNECKRLFRNSRIIGRRFKLVHIFFGPKIIETATFRQNPRNDDGNGEEGAQDTGLNSDSLLIKRDNVFGTAEDDALRRDFTLNGLFYDPIARKVIDFVDGKADLERRLIRTIGDADIRFQEDPVRILRAIKFAARLGLTIEEETLEAISRNRHHILECAKARVLEEIYRLLREGAAFRAFELLVETGVQHVMLPELTPIVQDEERRELLYARLQAVDALKGELNFTNPVLLAAVYYPLLVDPEEIFQARANGSALLDQALREVLHHWTPSRKDRDRTRQILMAQRRLSPSTNRRRRRRPQALVTQEYFADSLTLYKLCCHTGEADPSTIEKWESLAARVPPRADGGRGDPRKKRRRRRRRKPRRTDSDG